MGFKRSTFLGLISPRGPPIEAVLVAVPAAAVVVSGNGDPDGGVRKGRYLSSVTAGQRCLL